MCFITIAAGSDRAALGSDWPIDMGFDSHIEWLNRLPSLTQEEKKAIIRKNLEELPSIRGPIDIS